MPKAYVILTEAIKDQEGVQAYSRAAAPSMISSGASVLAVDPGPQVLEGQWHQAPPIRPAPPLASRVAGLRMGGQEPGQDLKTKSPTSLWRSGRATRGWSAPRRRRWRWRPGRTPAPGSA